MRIINNTPRHAVRRPTVGLLAVRRRLGTKLTEFGGFLSESLEIGCLVHSTIDVVKDVRIDPAAHSAACTGETAGDTVPDCSDNLVLDYLESDRQRVAPNTWRKSAPCFSQLASPLSDVKPLSCAGTRETGLSLPECEELREDLFPSTVATCHVYSSLSRVLQLDAGDG